MKQANASTNKFLDYKIHGIPVLLYVGLSAPVLIGLVTGTLGTDLMSIVGLMFTIGIFFSWVGDKIPIWNKWIGGGSMLAMMAPSFLVYKDVFPQEYTDAIVYFYDDMSFLNFYIIVLIAGGLLTVDRKMLIRTLKRCGPVFVGAVIFATIFGILGGVMTGLSVGETLAYYILPNLGGGNGSGAVPMSQIFQQVTGESKDSFYSKAIAILTLGSTIALVIGVILNRVGMMFPKLAGNGKTLLRNVTDEELEQLEEGGDASLLDMSNSLMVGVGFYALANIFGKLLLPSIGGIIIHPFAYLILFLTLANVFGLIPKNIGNGAEKLSELIVEKTGPMIFCGLGWSMMDFGDFLGAITLQNLFVSLMIIIGVVVGSGLVGWLVGFYPIDSIIVAGLTCSNRGDSADVILLSATDRMALLPYAQVISKLGGAIVLALSSMVFTQFFG